MGSGIALSLERHDTAVRLTCNILAGGAAQADREEAGGGCGAGEEALPPGDAAAH